MPPRISLLAILVPALWAQGTAPSYSAAGLVNAATNLPGPFAPNTWAVLYGKNLAWSTATAEVKDLRLPVQLGGVSVLLHAGTPLPLSYVSPGQINFLLPGSQVPDEYELHVFREGAYGPAIRIALADAAPALLRNANYAVAAHADGSVVTAESPAQPGEVIVLYASGLGQAEVPRNPEDDGKIVEVPPDIASIRLARFRELAVWLNGMPVETGRIAWAGLTPGFAGLYQINLRLPDTLDPEPEIRIVLGEAASPEGVKLATRP